MYITGIIPVSPEIIQPFVLGCETKNPKMVHLCLIAVQRLISHEAISVVSNACIAVKKKFINRQTINKYVYSIK